MSWRLSVLVAALVLVAAAALGPLVLAPPVGALAVQEIDTDVPPGNPVIGSDRPGDIDLEDDSNYGLWVVLAICLIGAGTLLIKIERWEARRMS